MSYLSKFEYVFITPICKIQWRLIIRTATIRTATTRTTAMILMAGSVGRWVAFLTTLSSSKNIEKYNAK